MIALNSFPRWLSSQMPIPVLAWLSSPKAAFSRTGVGSGEGPAAKLCVFSLVYDMMDLEEQEDYTG